MTTSAWIFLATAWTVIISMTLYCFARLLSAQPLAHSDAVEEAERREQEQEDHPPPPPSAGP